MPTVNLKKIAATAKKFGLVLVVQYGSSVDKSALRHEESDVDIAVLANNGEIELNDLLKLQSEFSEAVENKKGFGEIDLVDLASVNSLLSHRIATSGRVLYDSDGHRFHKFYVSAARRFIDDKTLYDFEADRLIRKVKEYA